MSATRVLRVRCSTWEQVEAFYRRKLRRSGVLSMKVPFEAAIGTPVTLGLELPNQIEGVFSCPNSNCISHNEPVRSRFSVRRAKDGSVRMKCHYCEKSFSQDIVAELQ